MGTVRKQAQRQRPAAALGAVLALLLAAAPRRGAAEAGGGASTAVPADVAARWRWGQLRPAFCMHCMRIVY